MVQFTAIVLGAIALAAGAQAACPTNGFFCGSELKDVYKCATEAQLKALTPPFDEYTTDIFPTNENGVPGIPSASCKNSPRGCQNSDLTANPPRFATCT